MCVFVITTIILGIFSFIIANTFETVLPVIVMTTVLLTGYVGDGENIIIGIVAMYVVLSFIAYMDAKIGFKCAGNTYSNDYGVPIGDYEMYGINPAKEDEEAKNHLGLLEVDLLSRAVFPISYIMYELWKSKNGYSYSDHVSGPIERMLKGKRK